MFKTGLMVFVFAFVLHGGAFARVMMMPQVEQQQADLVAPSVQGVPQQALVISPSDGPGDGVSEKMPMAEPPMVASAAHDAQGDDMPGSALLRALGFFVGILVVLLIFLKLRAKKG